MPHSHPVRGNEYSLGVDFAHLGEDSSCFIVLEKSSEEPNIYVCYIEETQHKLLTDAIGRIIHLDKLFNFKKIYCDYTGLGIGAVDVLKERLPPHKIEAFTFTIQSKDDMYSNLSILFEQGRLKIPNHRKLISQLCDLRYEYSSTGKKKIHHPDGGFDDFPDALALSALYFKPQRKGVYAIA